MKPDVKQTTPLVQSREASAVALRIRSSIQDHKGRGVTLRYTVMPTFRIQFKTSKIGLRAETTLLFIKNIFEKIRDLNKFCFNVNMEEAYA